MGVLHTHVNYMHYDYEEYDFSRLGRCELCSYVCYTEKKRFRPMILCTFLLDHNKQTQLSEARGKRTFSWWHKVDMLPILRTRNLSINYH